MCERDRVLAANEAFYQAFSAGDLPALSRLFAEDIELATAHPWRPAEHGRRGVLAVWESILAAGAPQIRCLDAQVQLLPGGESAFVTCVEDLGDQPCAATNVFVLEEGAWRLCHHHGAPLAPVFSASSADDETPVH